METLIQQSSRQGEREINDRQGKAGPFEGVVVSVLGRQDTIGVAFGPTPQRQMPVPHPFNGSTSWLRSMPEVSTRMLMQNRFDSQQPEALKTLPLPPEKRTADYLNQNNIYRTLDSGEHDMASNGFATMYLGRAGHLDTRSGAPIKHQLSYRSLSSESTAPTFIRNLLNEVVGTMGDEERLGIVKRWKTAIDHFYVQDANKNFQAERYLHMKNPAGSGPAVLLQFTEGQVYDDVGQQIKQASTGVPLRSQRLWYSTTDEALRQEIDQNGNVLLSFPSTATVGYQINVTSGNYELSAIDQTFTLTGNQNVTVQKNVHHSVQGQYNLDITKDLATTVGGKYDLNVTGNLTAISKADLALEGSGAKMKLTGGKVAIGNSSVELVDIVLQALNILSTTTAAGFGAPLSTVAQFAQLYGKLTPLKGSL